MTDQIVDHFPIAEFTRRAFTDHAGMFHPAEPYPAEWVQTRLPPLKRTAEIIRHKAGDHPMTILCGYRDDLYNAYLRERGLRGEHHATGVAEHSQHMEGRALDGVIYGMGAAVLYGLIIDLHEAGELPELGGVGLYEGLGFVHVDTYRLASGVLRRWNG